MECPGGLQCIDTLILSSGCPGKYHFNISSSPASHGWLTAYNITLSNGQTRPYTIPRRQDSFSSILSSYGNKALEGLPSSLSSTLGSFSFLGGAPSAPPKLPPKLPPRPNVQTVFEPELDEETKSRLHERMQEFIDKHKLRYVPSLLSRTRC